MEEWERSKGDYNRRGDNVPTRSMIPRGRRIAYYLGLEESQCNLENLKQLISCLLGLHVAEHNLEHLEDALADLELE